MGLICPECKAVERNAPEGAECFSCDVPLVQAKTLRQWQRRALQAAREALKDDVRGVIWACPGSGKSIVIAELVDELKRFGLHVVITVPSQVLVEQLARNIQNWTGQTVGRWYADVKDLWPITVVCQPSLEAYETAWSTKYDSQDRVWIADECHKTECETVLSWNAPSSRLGFSATPFRAQMSESVSAFDEIVYTYTVDEAYADGHVVEPTIEHWSGCGDPDHATAVWIKQQIAEGRTGVANAIDTSDANEFVALLRSHDVRCMATHYESEQDRQKAHEALTSGVPGCVVYVDMLAEGFDCPPIEFMALRRPVGSRVRFCQEVTRGLRSHPGKTTCYQLDVHDLWGRHALNWKAALGEMDDCTVPALKLGAVLSDEPAQQWLSGETERMPPEVLGPLRSWIRAKRVQMQFQGLIDDKLVESTHWRSDPCSRKQLAFLDDLMRRVDPSGLDSEMVRFIKASRRALKDCLARDPDDLDGAFRSGDASDLIDVVRGLR